MAVSLPIFDVALFSSNRIYFLRYASSKQGQQIYYGLGADGTRRLIHEVPGVDGLSQGYTPGQNIYSDWVGRGIKFESVADSSDNYRSARPDIIFKKNL